MTGILPILVVLIAVFAFLDTYTTIKINEAGGHENTAILRVFQRKLGLRLGTFVAKAIVVVVAVLVWLYVPEPWALILLLIGLARNAWVVWHNFGQMK